MSVPSNYKGKGKLSSISSGEATQHLLTLDHDCRSDLPSKHYLYWTPDPCRSLADTNTKHFIISPKL